MKNLSLALLIVISTSLCVNSEMETISNFTIIDGDTIRLESGQRVRLIGIDTPENGEYCYTEATEKLREMISGKELKLETGYEDKDVYGRLLRYVYVDDIFVNLEMVKSGFAFAIDTDDDRWEEFTNAEIEAENNNLGCLWSR